MDYFENALEDSVTALAHEIKNPVSLILASIEVIKMMDTSDEYTKYYLIIEREIHKINDIVNSLISLSVGTTRFARVEMSELIKTIVADRNQSYSGNPKISAILPKGEQIILGDKQGLEIVLSNVIKNSKESIEAASESLRGSDYVGKIEISASVEAGAGNGALHITIDDNGIGLAGFDKINATGYTTKKNGSGIGLSICQSIIERHRGEFKVIPLKKTGCRVEIMLPLCS